MVGPGRGELATSLRSLALLAGLAPLTLYPGHGPVVREAVPKLREYIAHRDERERQVIAALAAGATTPETIVPLMYGFSRRRCMVTLRETSRRIC